MFVTLYPEQIFVQFPKLHAQLIQLMELMLQQIRYSVKNYIPQMHLKYNAIMEQQVLFAKISVVLV